jgi:hypothetical protein
MDTRIETLREEIALRLRPVMQNLSEGEFSQLVRQMAELQDRYETRALRDYMSAETGSR